MFSPGCALMIYKPELATRIHAMLNEHLGEMEMLTTCCHHDPAFTKPTEVINICPGCDQRFRTLYENCTTISLWEVLADSDFFPFPDYGGRSMTIIDACPTRDQERVHMAIRKLLLRMNITVVEPKKTMTRSTCCGDSFYGTIPTKKVVAQMIKKASELPLNDVVVYCVSCSKAMFNGGRQARYLIDLLFSEETVPGICDPDEWHGSINEYIETH
jgi:Fe-S oxidoreductase